MRSRSLRALVAVSIVALSGATWLVGAGWVEPTRAASTLPPGFVDETLVSGLSLPTVMAIAPDGRVFVGEKAGVVKTWASFSMFAANGTPTIASDFQTDVDNFWDRGLLGLAVDPAYPASPYVYVLYTYDAPPGQAAPVWNDACPSPSSGGPGATMDGCVVQNRIDRLTVSPATGMTTARTPLLVGWCQQFPSHSAGMLMFGADGALYASGGEGSNFNTGSQDYGQYGGTQPSIANPVTPANPCGDPVNAAYLPGGASYGQGYDANGEGGALRAQSFRRTDGPVLLNGALLRLDKASGAGAAGNPASGSSDANARRIVAYGFRNPFRFTIRPGTNDVWIGNVGNATWETINRVPDPTASGGPLNFGWPCREGTSSNTYYTSFAMTQCTSLVGTSVTGPTFEYQQGHHIVSGDTCSTGGASISGLAFYAAASYPPAYRNALFFADYTRNCISVLQAGSDGLPDPSKPLPFGTIANPTQLLVDPSGNLLYVDFDQSSSTAGSIHRIRYQPPVASFTATPASGPAPLTVDFDGSSSTAPAGVASYDWDFGDGSAHGSAATVSHDYAAGQYTAKLTIADVNGSTATASHTISSGSPPDVTVDSPTSATTWAVGDTIDLLAHASDDIDTPLADSAYVWDVGVVHCPSDCHEHHLATRIGPSASIDVPDHDYPSWIKVTLTVTDSLGLSTTVTVDHVDPLTTTLTVRSSPGGLPVTLDGVTGTGTVGPETVIVGHVATIAAVSSVDTAESSTTFTSWSDGGGLAHSVTAPASPTTYTATYTQTVHDRSNTCAGAPIEPTLGAWWEGQFLTAGDVDWFRFKVNAASYRAVLGHLPTTASLELWSGCSTRLVASDMPGTNWEEILRTLPAGTYALKVTDTGGASPGVYNVRVSWMASPVGITTSRAIVGSSQVRIVGELYNFSSGYRSPTITARLYNAANHILATYTFKALVNPMGHWRDAFLLTVPRPAGFARLALSVTSTAVSAGPRRLITSGVTSGPGPGGTFVVQGTATNSGSTTATNARAVVWIFDTIGSILDATPAMVGSGGLTPHASATFHATFHPPTTVQAWRLVARAS